MDCARGGRDLVLFPNRCFFCRFGKLAPTLELISGDVEMISTTGGRVCRRTRWSRLAARSRYHYSTYNYNVIPAINVARPFIKHDLLFFQSPCSRCPDPTPSFDRPAPALDPHPGAKLIPHGDRWIFVSILDSHIHVVRSELQGCGRFARLHKKNEHVGAFV